MKLLALWLMVVFVLSVCPLDGLGRHAFDHADKAAHFILYAITGALLYRAMRAGRNAFLKERALLISLAVASFYGLCMEFAQGFTDIRNFSLWDEVANILGAALALAYIRLKETRK